MAEVLKEEGNRLMTENKPMEAIAKYTEAIDVAGTSHVLLSNRSAAYAKAKMWKEALEDANSCVSINEKFDKGYARKAGALMGMHKHEEALKVCKAGLSMCPQSEALKNKMKELEQPLPKPPQQQPQQQAYSSSASTSAISLPQRLFGFVAPVSFAYLLYTAVVTIGSGDASAFREISLIMALHMLVGLMAKHGVASFATLKSMFSSIRGAMKDPAAAKFDPSTDSGKAMLKFMEVQSDPWLHFLSFAVVISNATPLIPNSFIVATIAIMSIHVLTFAVAYRLSLPVITAYAVALNRQLELLILPRIPFLEVAIGLGLIADVFTPYRSLVATVMYFWVFQRMRLAPIPGFRGAPLPSPTRHMWSKVDAFLAPFFVRLPLVGPLYTKLTALAAKSFADPQGVAGRQ